MPRKVEPRSFAFWGDALDHANQCASYYEARFRVWKGLSGRWIVSWVLLDLRVR